MKLTQQNVRERFRNFWLKNGHKEVPPATLIPNDPTTLFIGSGMQQFLSNLLGEPHSLGKRLFNIQPCIRVQDIEEVGDNRHDTFFEMVGNWSLGDYFKKEQLSYLLDFLTSKTYGLGLDPQKLYVTAFKGEDEIPRDDESIKILKKLGFPEERIFLYGAEKNWWSRAGIPKNMPAGEPGGPDSEVFYDFGAELKIHGNSRFKNEKCHPNCDCGRYMEICNSVFMQYKKNKDGSFSELPSRNVDFGGGMERFTAVVNDTPDIFNTDLYLDILGTIKQYTNKDYIDDKNKPAMRIIADHLKAATFIISAGVRPSNKEQGYVLRRLLRRAAVKTYQLGGGLGPTAMFSEICGRDVLGMYDGIYFNRAKEQESVRQVVEEEINRFNISLDRGLKEIKKVEKIDGKTAFNFYQSYGFPLEITEELFKEKGQQINRKEFYVEFEKHKNLSRTASVGMFKGGLADHSEQVLKYHTATHLLHQALFDVLGDEVRQEGSNITGKKLRFDFSAPKKATEEEVKKVEEIMNAKIKESTPVSFKIIPKEEAYKIGAKSFFRERYPDLVKVYFIGDYSKEFCGGPHVGNTKEIGKIEIYKFEKIGSNLYRIYAK